jgi:hypothetical protein
MVTERDAKKIRKHGKLVNSGYVSKFDRGFRVYKYKNATYMEWSELQF